MTNQIVHYELDAHMSLSHTGLADLAKQRGWDVKQLRPGEFILFINRPFTAFKIFGANNVFAYYREPHDWALNPKALLTMVQCFDGVTFDYKGAQATEIERQLRPELRRAIKRREARVTATEKPKKKKKGVQVTLAKGQKKKPAKAAAKRRARA